MLERPRLGPETKKRRNNRLFTASLRESCFIGMQRALFSSENNLSGCFPCNPLTHPITRPTPIHSSRWPQAAGFFFFCVDQLVADRRSE
jgi:hypothetical protein